MYVGPPYCWAVMYSGRVTYCPLVSHGEYAKGTDGQTDGQTSDCYIMLSAKCDQCKNQALVMGLIVN